MQTLDTLPLALPSETIASFRHLSDAARSGIEAKAARQVFELVLIERYKCADIFLSDVAHALGMYPNIEATMDWLQDRGVTIAYSPDNREKARVAANHLVQERHARQATPAAS